MLVGLLNNLLSARLTRLGAYGGPRQLYGSFAGKNVALKPVDRITRLGLYGGPRQLYGSFAGKTPSAGDGPHPVARLTRLGMYGGPRQLYGSFAGKTASTPSTPEQGPFGRSPDRHRMLLNNPRNIAPRLFRRR